MKTDDIPGVVATVEEIGAGVVWLKIRAALGCTEKIQITLSLILCPIALNRGGIKMQMYMFYLISQRKHTRGVQYVMKTQL